MSREMYCPHCRKKLFSYEERIRKYDSPVMICKHCSGEYLDPRYDELAITGIPKEQFSIVQYLVMIILGILCFWRAYYLWEKHFVSRGVPTEVWVVMISIAGLVLLIGGIYEIITIKTGSKEEKFDRLYQESCERLRSKSYATKLKEMGYHVPDKFLED